MPARAASRPARAPRTTRTTRSADNFAKREVRKVLREARFEPGADVVVRFPFVLPPLRPPPLD